MKAMKKLASLLLVAAMCLSMAACGGPDKQPAIDAHNKAGDAINELGEIINANPEAYSEYLEEMNTLVDLMNQCGELLESDSDELDQEALDEWVEKCGEVEQWAKDAKAELEGN